MRKYVIYIIVTVISVFDIAGKGIEQKNVLCDTTISKNINGAVVMSEHLNLYVKDDYIKFENSYKKKVLIPFVNEFRNYDIVVYSGRYRELWRILEDDTLECMDAWNVDSLDIQKYMPVRIERNGTRRLFVYGGAQFNGGDGSSTYMLNVRLGTFLYKNYLDVAINANIGAVSSSGSNEGSGDIGISGRAYLPLIIKNYQISPYLGAGANYSFMPTSYSELMLYGGITWAIGPGALDVGIQYGTKSNFGLTFGYTFIPSL
ncbi:MAG: hypothetical protein IJN66_08665 [Muribaculaceae bacterium]|nr:hypothetical protein [Muribaculaceae bacterium]